MTTDYHVTAIRNGSVYGHSTDHCDESGCNGHERYLTGVYPSDATVGEILTLDDAEQDPSPATSAASPS